MFGQLGSPGRALVATLVVVGALLGGTTVVTAQDDSVSLVTDGGKVTVEPVENATIRGTSDLPADENLSVRVRSSGDTEPTFLKTNEVLVGEDGTFTATFDFSGIPANSTFTVTVVNGSETVAEADGVVVEQAETETTETTESTTGPSIPGFGPVAAVGALAALAAGALLVGRR
ncbi:BGTF surface domain-containing protein [Haloferax sp. S1W]|uniref:BGTF surface domain-containing protein n=1 Tax=Haloferax sp. S1W TaxID=3377110 RepID=UPI0037C857B4